MIWFVLSIPSGIGVALFMYGLPNIPPTIAMASGAIIVLGCIWIGIREQNHKKTEKIIMALKDSFAEIIWELETAKPDVIFQLSGFLEQHEKAKTRLEMDLNRKNTKRLNKIWEQYINNTKKYYSRISGLNSPTTENWPKKFLKEIKDMLDKIKIT